MHAALVFTLRRAVYSGRISRTVNGRKCSDLLTNCRKWLRKVAQNGVSAMPKINITAKWIASVKPPENGRDTWTDIALPGFAVVVSCTGKRVYYRIAKDRHKSTRTKLGDYPHLTVDAARRLCMTAAVAARDGKRPDAFRTPIERTLGEVWNWYWCNVVDGQHRTSDRTRRDWERLFAKSWAGLSLSSITRPKVIELLTRLRNGDGDGPHPGAVNTAVTLLRALFRTASDNGWMTSPNPMAGIKKDRIESRERFILPVEIEAFFTALSKLKQNYQDLFAVTLFTGARRENVLAMRWDEIDSLSRIWTITSKKAKAGASIRLPLSTIVEEILNRRFKSNPDSPWVFPSSRGTTGHMVEPKRQWAKLRSAAGLPDLHLHDLRRTLGSWQAMAGVSLITIGKTLGHKTSAATAVYARLQDETARESIQATNEALQKAGSPRNPQNDQNTLR